MPQFTYQATDENDQPVAGQISAENVAEAVVELQSRGLSVLSISQVEIERVDESEESALAGEESRLGATHLPGATPSDDTQVLREHAETMLDRREMLVPALNALADELPAGRYRRELRGLSSLLQRNASAEEICQLAGTSKLWLPLLANGPFAASSEGMLRNFFDESTREANLRGRLYRALAYPLAVVLLAGAVLVFLSIVLVPVYTTIFDDFDLVLPQITQAISCFSRLVRFYPIGLAVSVFLIATAAFFAVRQWNRWGLSEMLFGFATAGSSRNVSAMASFTQRLAELVRAGVELPAALRIAGQSCGNTHLRRSAAAIAHSVEEEPSAIGRTPAAYHFPPNVIYALQAGPSGGPSVGLLQSLSETYAEHVRDRVSFSTGVVGPIAIFAVGIVVGTVLLALLLPLISLINGFPDKDTPYVERQIPNLRETLAPLRSRYAVEKGVPNFCTAIVHAVENLAVVGGRHLGGQAAVAPSCALGSRCRADRVCPARAEPGGRPSGTLPPPAIPPGPTARLGNPAGRRAGANARCAFRQPSARPEVRQPVGYPCPVAAKLAGRPQHACRPCICPPTASQVLLRLRADDRGRCIEFLAYENRS